MGCSYHASAPSRVEDVGRAVGERRSSGWPPRRRCSARPGWARPTSAGARCTSPGARRTCCASAPCPTRGTSATCSVAATAISRSVGPPPSPSMRMNHCDVARKITGLWQRQQCGYAVVERLAVPQPAARGQRFLDLRVGVEHAQAAEERDLVEEVPARAHRRVDVEAVAHARARSRRTRGPARCGRRRCPGRASRSRPARRASRARRAGAGSAGPRARAPSCGRPGRPSVTPVRRSTSGASASATITVVSRAS